MKICWKPFIVSLFISLSVGGLSSLLTNNIAQIYMDLDKPYFSPPSVVFPIVWTVLYILMGVSSYLVFCSNSPYRRTALFYYFLQLSVNFLWPLLFFNLQAYLFALLWLVLLWVLIVLMINEMFKVNKLAAYLQIPYLLWVTFAGVLNFYIAKMSPLSY